MPGRLRALTRVMRRRVRSGTFWRIIFLDEVEVEVEVESGVGQSVNRLSLPGDAYDAKLSSDSKSCRGGVLKA